MTSPVGPLLSALSERILHNLKFIERHAHDSQPSDNAPEGAFAETQLIISLLGVLVFPQERTPLSARRLFIVEQTSCPAGFL